MDLIKDAFKVFDTATTAGSFTFYNSKDSILASNAGAGYNIEVNSKNVCAWIRTV